MSAESDRAYGDEAIYAAYKRFLEEVGELESRLRFAFRTVQFLSHSLITESNACNGRWISHHVWQLNQLLVLGQEN